jgi:hypothetical protein
MAKHAATKATTAPKPRTPPPVRVEVPTVGRIVHYRSAETSCLAAIITGGLGDTDVVNLQVFHPTSIQTCIAVPAGPGVGEWHWPERV